MPCGPFYRSSASIVDPFVQWSHDGAWLVIHDDDVIGAVGTDGSGYRRIVDVNASRNSLAHGLYADASPVDGRLVYTHCASLPEEPKAASGSTADGGYDPRPGNPLGYEILTRSLDPGVKGWKRLTENRGLDHFPVWSPDGTRIAYLTTGAEYLTDGQGGLGLSVMLADGGERRGVPGTTGDSAGLFPPVWSPDGQRLAFIGPGGDPSQGLGTVHTAHVELGRREVTTVGETTALPAWSPDGREVAIATYQEGVAEVLAVAYDGSRERSVWRSPEGTVGFPVTVLDWSTARGQLLFAADAVHTVDPESGEVRTLVHPGSNKGLAAAWSPDGTQVAVYQPCWLEDQLRDFVREAPGNSCYMKPSMLVVSIDGGQVRGLPIVERKTPEVPEPRPPVDLSVCSAGTVVPDPEGNPGLVGDCEVLLSVRDTLAGAGHLPWDGDTPIDQWQGIGLEHSPLAVGRDSADPTTLPRVRTFELGGRELTGMLPPELSRLTELELIHIGWTNIGGIIPPEWGRLTNLVYLSLERNALEGPIPPELGDLERLMALNLSRNNLTGTVPPELARATEIWQLSLADNLLVGSIPEEFAALTRLAGPSLWGNLWGGCISWELPYDWVENTGLERCP